MKPAWMLATLCTLLPLTSGPADPTAQRPIGSTPEDITLTCPDNGYPLEDLIRMASELTGDPFLYDPRDLKDSRSWFVGSLTVPRDRFLVVFDRLMRAEDFINLESSELGQTVHTIRKLGQQARGQQALKTNAAIVTPEEALGLAERQVLVTTTVSLENLPAREAVTTMQLYFSDSSTESIRNVEGTNVIVMTGFSNNIAALIRLLRRLDQEVQEQPGGRELRSFEQRLAKLEKQLAELQPAPAKPAGK